MEEVFHWVRLKQEVRTRSAFYLLMRKTPTLTVTADGNVRARRPEDPGYNEELVLFTTTTAAVLRDAR